MYSSTHSLSSHQRGVSDQLHTYSMDDGRPQSLCPLGRKKNLLHVPGMEPRRHERPAGSLSYSGTVLKCFQNNVRDANWVHLAQESVWRRALVNN